jgi:hypothetical protein
MDALTDPEIPDVHRENRHSGEYEALEAHRK